MLCDECGKRPATVHITKIENGNKTDIHLCEQCAMSKNPMNINTSFSINDLLAGILNNTPSLPVKMDLLDVPKCSVCGLNFNQFRQTGRFGCSNCYKVFGGRLNPIFQRLHGNISHTGKIPIRAGGSMRKVREIEKLRSELSNVIKNEEYERAAEIRDRIRELEKEGRGDENEKLDN